MEEHQNRLIEIMEEIDSLRGSGVVSSPQIHRLQEESMEITAKVLNLLK